MKISKMFLAGAMVLSMGLVGCSSNSAEAKEDLTGTYSVCIQGYDWGCGVTKAIVSFDGLVSSVDADDLKVEETKQNTDWTDTTFPVVEQTTERTVTDAYVSDENGEKTDGDSTYVTLEMSVDPNTGSPLLFSMSTQLNTWSDPYKLNISLNDGSGMTSGDYTVKSVTVDETMTGKTTSADAFSTDSYTAEDGVTYNYAKWSPEEDSRTLVVWLHGLGEGGTENTDPYVTTLANKVTALIGDEFQETIGNAHVLVPQCPTFWMDNDGKSGNFENGAINADGTSYYTESLHELINSYKEEVGAEKVIIAGCSNGGYMTMLMAKNYGDEYTAYVPICEALPDEYVTDEDIKTFASVPMYFIYSEDDGTVDPTKHEIPTIKRIKAAGAEDIHVSTTEHVIDESGEYNDLNDGNAYQYNGHWSWIYFDNNSSTCDDHGEKVWDWMASEVK